MKAITAKQYAQLNKIEAAAWKYYNTKWKDYDYTTWAKLDKLRTRWEALATKLCIFGVLDAVSYNVVSNGVVIKDMSHGYTFGDILA